MKVLFIVPEIRLDSNPIHAPFCAGILAAIVEQKGGQVGILDLNALRVKYGESQVPSQIIIDEISSEKWDMIVIGGLTRLTNSGLSMVDWRPIIGTFPPLTDLAWIEVYNRYKTTPEFQIVNKSMTLYEFKYIFLWEWFHRFFARCLGLVFILPLLYFWFKNI